MSRNLFTRLGRPPKVQPLTTPRHKSTGEKQGLAPSDTFRGAIPGKAYRTGGKVSYHDDPRMCPPKRR